MTQPARIRFRRRFCPAQVPHTDTLKQAVVNGVEFRRTICLYGVAGREQATVALAVLKLLRAADWSRYVS